MPHQKYMERHLFEYILVVAAPFFVVPMNVNADPPNIVPIIADELGWNDVG